MKKMLLSFLFCMALCGVGPQAFAADIVEFAGYVSAGRCSTERLNLPCSSMGKIKAQNFSITLQKGLNNDTYGKHTESYEISGYRFVAEYYIYKLDWYTDYSMTITINVEDPSGNKNSYELVSLRLNSQNSITPIMLNGREILTEKTDISEALTPHVYFGDVNETFQGLRPYIKY